MKIKIYQINMDRDEKRVAFAGMYYTMQNGGIDSKIYDCVFDGEVECEGIEDVFVKFNVDTPMNYHGRSMSVSDIVEIVESDSIKKGCYYCDNVGWSKIEFAKK